MTNSDFLTL